MRRLLYLLAAALSLASCKKIIWEERLDCPRFLYFDITNADAFNTYDMPFMTVYSHPKGSLMGEAKSTAHEIQDKQFYFVVRSTEAVKGYGLLGNETLSHQGSVWTAPIGQDYGPLFRFSYLEPTQEESFIVPVEFVKDHCHVSLQFVGMDTYVSTGGVFPFDIVVKCNTSGIDALDGSPVRGAFEARPKEQQQGLFEFTLPRLVDTQLTLELFGREGMALVQGHSATFNLYSILAEEGITWQEKNLPDVAIEIDYQEMNVDVRISPWDESTLHFEF